ncbi:HemK family protein methyltransferase [Longispora urticae]
MIVSRLRAVGCVFAEDEARLLVSAARTPAELAALVDRRVAGLPLEHVLGWAEFHGLRIAVDPGVFVPRRRTAFLADRAIALTRAALTSHGRAVVVDLCCGSGAVGAALLAALPQERAADTAGDNHPPGTATAPSAASTGPEPARSGVVELHAADIEPAAVRCARRNLGARGTVHEGDLYAPLPGTLRGRVDVLVANAPYVPTDAIDLMPPEARLYEPHVTLDGGSDGLDVQRRVAAGAARWLAPGGHLLVETGEHQAPATLELFTRHGLDSRIVTCDELSATVVIGTRPAARPPRHP